ncbi:MAG: sigma-54-dependent Fis family transcriptional regulator [Alphaproteobacteria bacterium]|nr:MAG: sigma-54-dependent Fis family transcriptional regulator [Alphaproteobacteria bacterium]
MAQGAAKQILLVEDSPSLARVYREYLRGDALAITHVESGGDALMEMSQKDYDAVILDLRLPDMDGLEVLAQMRERGISAAAVVITAHGSVNVAVDAMRAGAVDFLMKPFNADRLKITLENAIERQSLRQVVKSLSQQFDRDRFFGFIGASLPMQSVYRTIENAAPSKATVFITGESGTGKEVCAQAIHQNSPRAKGPFISINCGAIPKDLIESEIFGHKRGAFTGAVADREGAAAMADGGTLFLDEICEMDLRLQTKLLRFIQTGTIQKVGGSTPQSVDVRFICATNKNPLKAVEDGAFREDLYYRLHVVPIHMPPLRDRGEDVILIANTLLEEYTKEEGKSFKGFGKGAVEAIERFDWPGNVRQLQNVIRNAVVLNDGDKLTRAMLPSEVLGNQSAGDRGAALAQPPSLPPVSDQPREIAGRDGMSRGTPATYPASDSAAIPHRSLTPYDIRPLWEVEREVIEDAITKCGGNIPRAAAFLEVSPSTLYRKRQSWSLLDQDDLPPAARPVDKVDH